MAPGYAGERAGILLQIVSEASTLAQPLRRALGAGHAAWDGGCAETAFTGILRRKQEWD